MTPNDNKLSDWLGVRFDSGETWKKSLETLACAGNGRITGDENVERGSRMEVRRDQKRGGIERRGRPKRQTEAALSAWWNREGTTPN